MADNILRAIINVSAPGATQAFNEVSNGAKKTETSLRSIVPTASSAGNAIKGITSTLVGLAGALAVGLIIEQLVKIGQKFFELSEAEKRAAEETKKAAEVLKDSISGAAKEATNVGTLIAVLKSETETRERKLAAIKELQKIQPEVFSGLKLEGTAVEGLDQAYRNYISNLSTIIAVKIKQSQLEELITKQLQLQGITQTKSEKEQAEAAQKRLEKAAGFVKGLSGENKFLNDNVGAQKEFNLQLQLSGVKSLQILDIQKNIAALISDISELSKGVGIKIPDGKKAKDEIEKNIKRIKPDVEIKLIPIVDPNDAKFQTNFTTELTRVQQRISELIKNNPILLEFEVRNKASQDLFKNYQEQALKSAEIISGTLTPAFQGLFDAITSGGDGLKGFLDGLVDGVKQLILQLIKAAIFAAILSAITGGTAGSFSALFTKFSGFGSFGGGKAIGGNVSSGRGYIVGENGPEWFQPNTGGRIIPNSGLGFNSSGISPMALQLSGAFEIRGNSLVALISKVVQSQSRNV